MIKKLAVLKNKRVLMVLGALLAIIVIALILGFPGGDKVETDAQTQVFTVEKRDIEETFETTGIIAASEEAVIVAPFTSGDLEIKVQIGQRVEAGEVLGILDTEEIEELVRATEISLLNYESQRKQLFSQTNLSYVNSLAVSKASYEEASKDYEANLSFYETGSISKQVLDQSKDLVDQAYNDYLLSQKKYEGYDVSSEIAILDKSIESELKKLEGLKEDFEQARIKSPIEGTVTSLEGEDLRNISKDATLFTVTNLEALEVEVAVSEYEVHQLAEGQSAMVYTLADSTRRYPGTVSQIYPVGDVQGSEVTVTIIVTLDEVDANIKPGFSAGLEILVAQAKEALVVPYDAILLTPEGSRVMKTDAQGSEVPVVVQTGIESDLMIEVMGEGLKEGDQVLVYSTIDLTRTSAGGFPVPGSGRGNPGPMID